MIGNTEKELNIWDEESCGRCGACCYYFLVVDLDKPPDKKCSYLVVDEKNHLTSCSIYFDKNKPKCCGDEEGRGWTCYHGNSLRENSPNWFFRKHLREIAVNILHSRPESALEKEYRKSDF